jgi:hypothetical protein
MQVRILNDDLEVIWTKTETGGLTSLSFRRDGTIEMIISKLETALEWAREEAIQPDSGLPPAPVSIQAIDEFLQRNSLVDVGVNQLPDTR